MTSCHGILLAASQYISVSLPEKSKVVCPTSRKFKGEI